MKLKFSLPAVIFAIACTLVAPAKAQIAITEFFPNPATLGDANGEFVELFNFSTDAINLNGWAISDEDFDSDIISETDLFIAPGGYLVLAKNKAALEGAFFGGLSNPNIIEITGLTLANSGDEIVLTDSDQQVVWSIAYPNGEGNGSAAFLHEDDFTITVWGAKDSTGIDFADIDPATITNDNPEGRLGYQDNATSTDPNATTTPDGDTASPLAGFYTIGGGGGGPVTPTDFRILSILPGTVAGTYDITFESKNSELYTLESSTDLTAFDDVAPVTGTGSTTTVTATPAPSLTRIFYRLKKGIIVVGQ